MAIRADPVRQLKVIQADLAPQPITMLAAAEVAPVLPGPMDQMRETALGAMAAMEFSQASQALPFIEQVVVVVR
jgi:hypothetical protein